MLQQAFIAGSMMAGRLEALKPIADFSLNLADFEPEQGQTDGTLAHALERWLCCTAAREGWHLGELPGDTRAVPGFGYAKASTSSPGTDN
jgi:lipopolysaccharide biosynthesis protein